MNPDNPRCKQPEIFNAPTFNDHCRARARRSDRYRRFTGAGRGLFLRCVHFKLLEGRRKKMPAKLRQKDCKTHIVRILPLVRRPVARSLDCAGNRFVDSRLISD
jgi:hypothetical protein